MKKVCLSIFLVLFFSQVVCAKNLDDLDVKSNSFLDLGRYVETLEINDEPIQENEVEVIETKQDNFEEEAIHDVAKRYEENAVELKLDDVDEEALTDINNDRIFKLRINENQYSIEQNIKTDNMIWDGSKMFTQAFAHTTKSLSPIPGVVNSSNVSSLVAPDLEATVGQTYLFNSLGPSVLFVRANESMYNTGSVVSYKGGGLNLAVGSFSTSYNHLSSGGAILTSDSILLPKNVGSILIGGAYFANEETNANKSTGGAFAEYTYKRLKLNAQIGQSKYNNSPEYNTSLYFIPEFRISDSLYLKTRFIRNVTKNTMQDEVALTYKPFNNNRNLEIEINASNSYDQMTTLKQKIKLTTSFRI